MPRKNGKNGKSSSNEDNGKPRSHLPNGRFAPGNKCGGGNPHANMVARFRTRWLKIAKEEDVEKAYNFLVQTFTNPKTPPAVAVQAVEKFLDRTVGKPDQKLDVGVTNVDEALRHAVAALMRDDVIARRIEALEMEG